ncbi:TolC family protein [Dyella agri]|uniref:TolC family protein n=1 Tax=Dyella agri TaxID=1926869 RepID=A0ABW8KFW5_9GAMM
MSFFRAVPVGAVCLWWATWLPAAPLVEPVAAPAPLREAVQAVWQASPEVAAAKAGFDAAAAQARAAARPLYNPELQFEVENADVDRRVAGVGLTLDLSGKRRARATQGEAVAQASEAAYALARRDVATRWLKAWVAQAQAARQIALGRQRVELMRRFDALAAERLRVGDVSSPERDLAALALGEAQMQQAALVGQEASARAALTAIAGPASSFPRKQEPGALPSGPTPLAPGPRRDDGPVDLPPMPVGLPPPADSVAPVEVDVLPELAQARAEQQAAAAGVRVARRARVPDPTVSLTGGEVRSGSRHDRVIGLNVSLPLPLLNSGSAEVAAALAEEDAASARRRASEFAQHAGREAARVRYAALRETAGAFRQGRAGAFAERTALLEKLWRAGEIGTGDYLTQLKQSLDTALSGQELQAQAWQAWFDHLAAAGRLNDWLDGRGTGVSP